MKRIVTSVIVTAFTFVLAGFGTRVESQKAESRGNYQQSKLLLPMKEGSVRFAIVGDTGSGTNAQRRVAEAMLKYRSIFPFDFVLMLGDNLYGGEKPEDYDEKFFQIYKPLLDQKVKFYAALGNHDDSNQRFYEHFNMDGKEYYSFKKGNARFWALNSNYMEPRQLKWLEEELAQSGSDWKICFFHHPPYSSGKRHGSDKQLREVLEPVLVKHQVNVVFAGHEHFYERLKPQKGIYYFISGAGGKLHVDGVRSTGLTEKSYDQDMHFMIVEITGDELHFQTISRTGRTIDSGVISRQKVVADVK